MRELGLTELFFESAEPDADTALDLFEDGVYIFLGRTIEGEMLVGTGELSHEVPEAPEFTPADGSVVDPDDVVVEWEQVEDAETYQVIVESDDAPGALDVRLPGSSTSLEIPADFLEEDTEYKIEVLAKFENGNQTLTENVVTTSDRDNEGPENLSSKADPATTSTDATPNPFQSSTSIRFALAQAGPTLVQVYDVQGRLIRTIMEGHRPAGVHEVIWNGKDSNGAAVGGGVYFARIKVGDRFEAQKLIMTR
jgi:hypothetical protein